MLNYDNTIQTGIPIIHKTKSMNLYYWKPIKSEDDLPKETKNIFKRDSNMWFQQIPQDGNIDKEFWEGASYLCPIQVEQLPEWVEGEAEKYAKENVINPNESEQWLKEDVLFGAKLILPLLSQNQKENKELREQANTLAEMVSEAWGAVVEKEYEIKILSALAQANISGQTDDEKKKLEAEIRSEVSQRKQSELSLKKKDVESFFKKLESKDDPR